VSWNRKNSLHNNRKGKLTGTKPGSREGILVTHSRAIATALRVGAGQGAIRFTRMGLSESSPTEKGGKTSTEGLENYIFEEENKREDVRDQY